MWHNLLLFFHKKTALTLTLTLTLTLILLAPFMLLGLRPP